MAAEAPALEAAAQAEWEAYAQTLAFENQAAEAEWYAHAQALAAEQQAAEADWEAHVQALAAEQQALEQAAQADWEAHVQALAAEHQAAQAEQASAAPSVAEAAAVPEASEPTSASNTAAGCPGVSGAEQMGASCATTLVGSEYSRPDSGGEPQTVGSAQVLIELGSSDSDEEAGAVPVAGREFQNASDIGQEDAADGEHCPAMVLSIRCLQQRLTLQTKARIARAGKRWCWRCQVGCR